MAQVLVVTSGKGGVGKTTSTAALGAALAQGGAKVVVIDFDVGLRNLDLVMGAERRVVFDLINVINGVAKVQQALIRDKRLENLHLLPASQTRDKEALTEEGVAKVIDEFGAPYSVEEKKLPDGTTQEVRKKAASGTWATYDLSSAGSAKRKTSLRRLQDFHPMGDFSSRSLAAKACSPCTTSATWSFSTSRAWRPATRQSHLCSICETNSKNARWALLLSLYAPRANQRAPSPSPPAQTTCCLQPARICLPTLSNLCSNPESARFKTNPGMQTALPLPQSNAAICECR